MKESIWDNLRTLGLFLSGIGIIFSMSINSIFLIIYVVLFLIFLSIDTIKGEK
jgi:hypothetical protein